MPPIDNCVSSPLTVLSQFPISNLAAPDIPLSNVSVCLRPPASIVVTEELLMEYFEKDNSRPVATRLNVLRVKRMT